MKLLDWVIAKLTYFEQAAYLRDYEKNVHGGPAPAAWREREGIPSSDQWPKQNLVVGAVRCGRVRPVAAEAFPTGGNRDFKKYPIVVCLCGSTRFKDAFDEANYQETMAGHIVLSVGFFMHASGNRHGDDVGCTPEQKIALDELHKRKIDLADEVLVLNVGGYVGESTRSEIEYAIGNGKPVKYLENENA
jgi:hypothetical protein